MSDLVAWAENHLWWWAYRRYLRSRVWESLRATRMEIDGHICPGCKYRTVDPEIHHLFYKRWWWYALAPVLGLRENLYVLITLCRRCHLEAHGRQED